MWHFVALRHPVEGATFHLQKLFLPSPLAFRRPVEGREGAGGGASTPCRGWVSLRHCQSSYNLIRKRSLWKT